MTVQEKSKELVWKFYNNIEHTISNEYSDKDWEIAKQCALIAVDAILEAIKGMVDEESGYSADGYYLEVKQEILKL